MKAPVRKTYRARAVNDAPPRRSARLLKRAVVAADPPKPEGEGNGHICSDKLAPTSEDEGPPFPVGPRQQSFPDAGFHLHGTDNEPIDGDERTLVEALPTADKDLSDSAAVPTLSTTVLVGGDGDAQVECDEMMELGELLYPEMRDIKECIGAAFEVARVCYFCLVDKDKSPTTFTNATPEQLAFHLRTVHHPILKPTSNMSPIDFFTKVQSS
ncbi:hypothetical protein C8R46DRAFT_1228042 [Mycena filopes]|nr:hypothetical protein C8R46DRAFT_1228042 [Mycena filopes]